SVLAVLLQNDGLLDAKSAAQVQDGLQGVAKIAPLTRAAPPAAQPAQPCTDDACLASLGAAQKLDELLVASYARGTLRLKLIDVAAKKSVSEAEQASVPPELATAWAEARSCRPPPWLPFRARHPRPGAGGKSQLLSRPWASERQPPWRGCTSAPRAIPTSTRPRPPSAPTAARIAPLTSTRSIPAIAPRAPPTPCTRSPACCSPRPPSSLSPSDHARIPHP